MQKIITSLIIHAKYVNAGNINIYKFFLNELTVHNIIDHA